jgi:uncharacterized protein
MMIRRQPPAVVARLVGVMITATTLWMVPPLVVAWQSPNISAATHHRYSTPSTATIAVPVTGASTTLRMGNTDDDEDDVDTKQRQGDSSSVSAINVLGTPLECCCADVQGTGIGTGFYRNGYCATGERDFGRHTVCVAVTQEFLDFSRTVGNDLSTPAPHYLFPGLNEGDIWCLCAERWFQAFQAGKAPKLFLHATHEKTLDYVPFDILRGYAIDAEAADARLTKLNEQRSKLNKLLE